MSLFPELDTIDEEEKKRRGEAPADNLFPELGGNDSSDLFPELKAPPAAPPVDQASGLSKNAPPAAPLVRPSTMAGETTDEGVLSQKDHKYLDYIKALVKPALPGPLQPVADILDKPAEPAAPVDESLFPELERKKQLRDTVVDQAANSVDPVTGQLLKTDIGKRMAADVASGGLGTAAGMVASIPAAEAWFDKDTWHGQKAKEVADWLKKTAADLNPENPNFVDQLASGAGSMALFMVPSSAAGVSLSQIPRMGMMAARLAPAIGAGVSAVLEAGAESGSVYQDQIDKGISRDMAAKAAFRDFWQNVILVGITNKLGVFGEAAGPIKKALMSASMEGIQEGAQSIISSLAKNEPIDWKGDVLPSAGVGAILGGGAGPLMEGVMEDHQEPAETTITDKTLGPNGSAYLREKFPQLYQNINNQTVPMSEDQIREHLIAGAAAGEEVILKGGTPEQAQQAALDTFTKSASAQIQAAQAAKENTATPPEGEKPAKPSIEELMPEFDPKKLEAETTVAAGPLQEMENDAPEPINLPDKKIRIKKADIETEARYLHGLALEQREGKLSPLETFVKENGGISTYSKDPSTGKVEEREEYRNIPVRLRGQTSYDEMLQMARDNGVVPHDAPYSALYDALSTLGERGAVPRVSDFYDEARRNIEYEKLQEHAKQGGEVPPDIQANYSAARYKDLQARAKTAAERVLQTNKIDDRVLIDLVDAIQVDPEAFKRGYGAGSNPADFDIKGETRPVADHEKIQAVINLARGATEATGRHEAFHAVSNILLDEAENKIITDKYGNMEKAADAFGEYRGGKETDDSLVNKVFQKIKEFLEKVGNFLDTAKFTTADELFKHIEEGRFSDRAARDEAKQQYSAEAPKVAKFIGWQEMGKGFDPEPIFNITRESAPGSHTVLGETATSEGWTLPVYPPFEEWQRSKREGQYSAVQNMREAVRKILTRTESVKPEIQSPEFQRWFSNSQIVDENGAPKIVYHGTEANFTAFDPRKRELGFHFGSAPAANDRINVNSNMRTGEFGLPELYLAGDRVLPVYLKMDQPIRLTQDVGGWSDVPEVISQILHDYDGIFNAGDFKGVSSANQLRQVLENRGYDGIIYPNEFEITKEMSPAERESYIVFEPEQVKSAFNLGSFDPMNADIRYSASKKEDSRQMDLFNEKGEATIEAKQRDPFELPLAQKKADPLPKGPTPPKAGEELADVGQQLWYNRRNFTGKGLDWNTVKDLNPALKVREVAKPKVWTKPDYEALVRDGMQPFTAHMVKQIYDSIAIKPDVRGTITDEHMKAYIDGVGKVRDAVFAWAKSRESQAALLDKLVVSAKMGMSSSGLLGGASGLSELTRSGGSLLDQIFPPKEGQEKQRRFYANPEYNDLALLLGGRKFVNALQPGYEQARTALKALNDGWPSPQEAWSRQFSVKAETVGTKVWKNGASHILTEPEYYVVRKATRRIMQDGFKTQGEAEAFARSLVEKKNKGAVQRLDPLQEWEREGPPRRKEGENVEPQRLMDDYGFRGVNYGNWVNQDERQSFTNQAYDALGDLAAYLKVPPKALSLNGLLGLAFGAQGRGGMAAAHFVPGVNEINLTKTAGAGALAHEWGHALDHYFAVQVGEQIEKARDPFLTSYAPKLKADGLKSLRPEILQAFTDIVDAMKVRTETPEDIQKRIEAQDKVSMDRMERWLTGLRKQLETKAVADTKETALKEFDKAADRIRKGDLGEGYVKQGSNAMSSVKPVIADVREIFKQATGALLSMDETKGLAGNADHIQFINSAKGQEMRHAPQKMSTDYLKEAESMDKDKGGKVYWSQPTELFARAFESHVLDGLAAKAERNDYLTRPQPSAGEKGATWFPQGVEREKINAAFKKLIAEIKTKEGPKGPIMYSATEKPVGGNEIVSRYEAVKKPDDEFYAQNRALQRTPLQGAMKDFNDVVRDLKKGTDRVLGTLATRLGNIDPSLKRAIRWYEFKLANRTMEDLKSVEPFLKKVSALPREVRLDFDLARKNGDMDRIMGIVSRYNLGTEYFQVRKTLNDVYKRAKDVDFDLGYLENYFPRKLKDSHGFLDYVSKRDDWSIIQEALNAKETALGRYLSVQEKAEVINSLIRGTRKGLVSLSETGNMKDRVIPVVDPIMNQFYYSSDAAMVRYLNEVNAAIEARRFFGKGTAEKKSFDYGEPAGMIDVDNSIGGYVLDLLNRGVIKPSQEKELRDMLAARFAPTGVGSVVGLFRNLSYIDAMGSPITALTQIGDMGFALYRGGLGMKALSAGMALAGGAVGGVPGAIVGGTLAPVLAHNVQKMMGKKMVTRQDIGVDKIAQEFADPARSYKMLEKTFKLIGLDKLDAIGKEIYINTILDKYRAQLSGQKDTGEVFERLNRIFGPETPQAIADIQAGRMTENVKYLLFSELSDIQPISMAEVPEKYLSGGNGRIFYMLKSFTIKQIDLFRTEAFQKMAQPGAANKIEGVRRLVMLASLLALSNSGADILKNLFLNRPTNLSDMVVDNVFRLMGVSKFIIYDARRRGLGEAAVKLVLPPMKLVDSLYRDFGDVDFQKPGGWIDDNIKNQKLQGNFWKGDKMETPASIPLLGKLYYWWFGKGTELSEKTRKRMRKAEALSR